MCIFARYQELHLFDRGPHVLEVSKLLAYHGSKLQETDYYSIAMLSAVYSFKKKHGLEKSDIIDKKTWKALRKKHRKC